MLDLTTAPVGVNRVNQREAPDWFVPSAEVAAPGRQRWHCHSHKATAKNIKWDRLVTASCSLCRPGEGCRDLSPEPCIAHIYVNEGTASGNASRHLGNQIQNIQKVGVEPTISRRRPDLQSGGQPVDHLLEWADKQCRDDHFKCSPGGIQPEVKDPDTKPRKQKGQSYLLPKEQPGLLEQRPSIGRLPPKVISIY